MNNLTNGITLKSVTNGIIVSSCCHAGHHRVRNSSVISAFTVRTILRLAKRTLFVKTKKLKQVSRWLLLGIGLSQLRLGCWALITALAPALTSCMGIYEGGFECPPGHGVGCKSISDVNQMVNQGELPEKAVSDLPPSPSQSPCEQCGAPRDQPIDPQHPEKPEIWYPPLVLEEA